MKQFEEINKSLLSKLKTPINNNVDIKNEYKENLDYIITQLNNLPNLFEKIDKSSISDDGRDKSKSGEDIILGEIKKLNLPYPMLLKFPGKRSWYDFSMDDLPINIKITNAICPDNSGSKLAVYVACTGLFPQKDPHMEEFIEMLDLDIKQSKTNIYDIDYIYLVFNKKNKKIHWIGARQLNEIQSNGKNQPFQIHWAKNIIPIKRNISEARKFLLSTYFESINKAAQIQIIFSKFYNNFMNNN